MPLFLICIVLPFIVPESPRWLYEHGKVDESIGVLERIGKLNGKSLSIETENRLRNNWTAKSDEKPNIIQLLIKHKTLALRFFILLLIQ